VYKRAERDGPEAKASFGILGRDVVLQVLDSFFLLRDNPLHKVGIVDVYSINSSVKVLRVDGKLPFDSGYALKGI
jgi:hypothetical protein